MRQQYKKTCRAVCAPRIVYCFRSGFLRPFLAWRADIADERSAANIAELVAGIKTNHGAGGRRKIDAYLDSLIGPRGQRCTVGMPLDEAA